MDLPYIGNCSGAVFGASTHVLVAGRLNVNDFAGQARPYIVKTTRNCALPLTRRAHASFTFSSGNFSIIGRTPVYSEKRSVSSESGAVPDAQPLMSLFPKMSCVPF